MGCYKLDKIDKIVISFTFIIVTLSCIFNVFSNASEFVLPEGFYKLDKQLYLKDGAFGSGNVVSSDSSNIFRVELLNGANYIYISSPYFFHYCLSNDEISIGDSLDSVSAQAANSAVYLYNNGDFKYLYLSYFEDNNIDVYTNANGLTSAISDLSRFVDIKSIWLSFQNLIPLVLPIVLFSLGFWFISHNILEHSKGRDF